MPTNHDETLLQRYQREHRVYEGMMMSKAERLAKWHDDMASEPRRNGGKRERHAESSAELRRLSAINAELIEALIGLMNAESRGRVMPIGKEWDAAREAIAKAQGEQQ